MEFTIRDAGDALIWVGAIAAALVAVATFFHRFVVIPLRAFIRDEVGQISGPLQTKNGKTVAQYVEGSAKSLHEINDQVGEMRTALAETNKLALQNQNELLVMGRRLDRHLVEDHQK